jgi:restriction system protein
MRFREYPLLNIPNMVAIILREAAGGAATLAGCGAQLQALLDRADEHPPFGPEDAASRLQMLIRYLAEARLIAHAADGSFALTDRGRAALAEHPAGFDGADLMVYPEFARYIRGLGLRRGGMDPRAGGYDAGFHAYLSGESPADNPYPADSADHLAWENGWSEALDEDFRWPGPRYGPPGA